MKIIDINGSSRECEELSIDPNFPGYVKAGFESKNRKGQVHSEWYPINEFLLKNPDKKELIKNSKTIPEEDLGIVSLASSITVHDKTKNWETNIFAGRQLWISRGVGEGQIRSVVSNTSDTLVLDKEWEIKPDKTSQYVISDNVHDPQVMGNTLPGFPAKVEKIKKSDKKDKK